MTLLFSISQFDRTFRKKIRSEPIDLYDLLRLRHQAAKACRHHISRLLRLNTTFHNGRESHLSMLRFTKNNGFHRKMKLIQRRAYGFKNFHNYRLRVIAQCG